MTKSLKIVTAIIYLSLIASTVFVSMTITEAVAIGKMAAKIGIAAYAAGIIFFLASRVAAAKNGRFFSLASSGMPDSIKFLYRMCWFLLGFGFVIHAMLVFSAK